MKTTVILFALLISTAGSIHAQGDLNNFNIQISPWMLGQVKVKAEFARSGRISFGSYVKYSWRSETLYEWKRMYNDYGEYKGIRFEPFTRFYLLPKDHYPLNGFYLQVSLMYGRYYQDSYQKYIGRFWDGPYSSAGAGLKTGFQKVFGVISVDMGLGCKFFTYIETLDLPDEWWLGPGCPVSADLLIGIRF